MSRAMCDAFKWYSTDDIVNCWPYVCLPNQLNKAKQEKHMVCCVRPLPPSPKKPIEDSNGCRISVGVPCGPMGGYAEDMSLCCNEGAATGVLFCDEGRVGLTYQLCPASYSCMEHSTIRWKRDVDDDGDEEGTYAQCELKEH
jgi:hypothetical protein